MFLSLPPSPSLSLTVFSFFFFFLLSIFISLIFSSFYTADICLLLDTLILSVSLFLAFIHWLALSLYLSFSFSVFIYFLSFSLYIIYH